MVFYKYFYKLSIFIFIVGFLIGVGHARCYLELTSTSSADLSKIVKEQQNKAILNRGFRNTKTDKKKAANVVEFSKQRGILYYGMTPPNTGNKLGYHISLDPQIGANDQDLKDLMVELRKKDINLVFQGIIPANRFLALQVGLGFSDAVPNEKRQRFQGIFDRLIGVVPGGVPPHVSILQISNIPSGNIDIDAHFDSHTFRAVYVRAIMSPDAKKYFGESRPGQPINPADKRRLSEFFMAFLRDTLDGVPLNPALTAGVPGRTFNTTTPEQWAEIARLRQRRAAAYTSPQQIDGFIRGNQWNTMDDLDAQLSPILNSLFSLYTPDQLIEIADTFNRTPTLSYLHRDQIQDYMNSVNAQLVANPQLLRFNVKTAPVCF